MGMLNKHMPKLWLITIEEVLTKHNLGIENIRGQGYDGAANVSDQYSGVQSRIHSLLQSCTEPCLGGDLL